MAFVDPTTPNLPDFMTFVYDVMQVNVAYLPVDSTAFTFPFYRARELVICPPFIAGGSYDYTSTVYNCGGHLLVSSAQDQDGRTFFRDLRKEYGLSGGLAAGVVQSTSDQATSTTLAVPDALKNLTIGDLGFLKTPWGRAYLAYAQDFGGIWGLS